MIVFTVLWEKYVTDCCMSFAWNKYIIYSKILKKSQMLFSKSYSFCITSNMFSIVNYYSSDIFFLRFVYEVITCKGKQATKGIYRSIKKDPNQQNQWTKNTPPRKNHEQTKQNKNTQTNKKDRNEPKPRNMQEKNVSISRCFAQGIKIL